MSNSCSGSQLREHVRWPCRPSSAVKTGQGMGRRKERGVLTTGNTSKVGYLKLLYCLLSQQLKKAHVAETFCSFDFYYANCSQIPHPIQFLLTMCSLHSSAFCISSQSCGESWSATPRVCVWASAPRGVCAAAVLARRSWLSCSVWSL